MLSSAKEYPRITWEETDSRRAEREARNTPTDFIWKEYPAFQSCHILSLDLDMYVFSFLGISTFKI